MENWFWIFVIPLIIGLILYFIEYRSGIFVAKKSLKIEILVNTPLFRVNVYKGYVGKIDVYFNGEPIDDLSIFALRFSNTGRIAIKSEDYEKPLNINFVHPTSIKQIDIASSEPSDLPISFEVINNNIIIEPLLLNAGDYFTLNCLLSKVPNDQFFNISGRVVDIPKVEIQEAKPLSYRIRPSIVLLLISIAIILASGVFLAINVIQNRP